ncbi:MAG: hypothetical protein M3Y50_16775 [Acidobacteriota bacterium]|nr:hypothetical protein [Acidobacteriota bacterium]
MKDTQFVKRLVRFSALLASLTLPLAAVAQSAPAGTQQLQLSAFIAGTGTFTNFEGGKNLDVTAGADLDYLGFRHFTPGFEVRGSYPIDGGHISSQKSFLLGPRLVYPIGRLHPYVDFLVGRGQIEYLHGGFIVGYVDYLSSNTFVYSPGVGLNYNLTHNLALKADVQYQHWNLPFTPPGSIHPKAISLGGVYTFDFNRGHRHQLP